MDSFYYVSVWSSLNFEIVMYWCTPIAPRYKRALFLQVDTGQP